tara:strand:- start:31 stop:885 length:855 start_codon:yes stop_codon:yes gene_type:complete
MRESLDNSEIINLQRYPVNQPGDARRQQTVEQVRAQLAEDGCAVIRNFFSPAGLQVLLDEANARKANTYYSPTKLCNVYLNDGDEAYPEDHARNIFIPRSNGFITADCFDENSNAYRLYHWAPLKQFLADCLGKPELFIYEDPVSNMIVNVSKPGQLFNWHFDTNEFTITMLLRPASEGGDFEYVPALRSQQDEHYDEVKKVLRGDRSRVRQLKLQSGDLQFFLGRYSLHRVSENLGDTDRLLLIMSFTEKPGVLGNKQRVRNLYGKLSAEHERASVRSDGLVD